MPTSIQIQNTLLSAQYKNAVAMQNDYNLINSGGTPRDSALNNFIWLTIDGLQYQFNLGNYNTATTISLYDKLNRYIGFDTNINSLDPNAQIPGTIIEIINPAGYIAPIPSIPWSSFDAATQQPDGGRYIYYNTNWAGYNPILSLISPAETALTLGVDYTLISTGGIQLLNTSTVLPYIYDGQSLRSVGYVQA